jgi:hypothetical protein
MDNGVAEDAGTGAAVGGGSQDSASCRSQALVRSLRLAATASGAVPGAVVGGAAGGKIGALTDSGVDGLDPMQMRLSSEHSM